MRYVTILLVAIPMSTMLGCSSKPARTTPPDSERPDRGTDETGQKGKNDQDGFRLDLDIGDNGVKVQADDRQDDPGVKVDVEADIDIGKESPTSQP